MRRGGIKPLVGDALVAVQREAERDIGKRLAAFRCELRWEGDGEIRALGDVLRLGDEVVEDGGEDGGEGRVRGAEARGEEVAQSTGDLVGYGGWDNGGGLAGSQRRCVDGRTVWVP